MFDSGLEDLELESMLRNTDTYPSSGNGFLKKVGREQRYQLHSNSRCHILRSYLIRLC